MSGVIEYSHEADEDLLALHAFITQRDPQSADRVIRQLDAKCRLLAQFPGTGAPREHIRPGMRLGILGKYLFSTVPKLKVFSSSGSFTAAGISERSSRRGR